MAEKKVSVRLAAVGGRQVRAELEGVGNSGAASFQKLTCEVDVAGVVLRRLAGIAAGAFSLRQVVDYADTWTDLRSRVDLATGSQERGAAVMERLADMARRTYSSLGQTTESWLANATALRELGLSTRESLDFTEALNNAMVVSGARAERAASVQNALSKAMALGTLSGDNLNTVIASGGRVAELLAAELGTGVNQLRGLGSQGAITGEVIRSALVGNLALLRAEAESMPATIGDAFTLMGNAALRLVGTWDQMAGASATVADAIILLADNLERLAAIGIAVAGFMAGRWVAAFVAARVATFSLSTALVVLRGAIIRTGIGALIVGAGELVYQFGRLVQGAGGFGNALELMGNVARAVWDGIKATTSSFVDSFRALRSDVEAIWLRLMRFLAGKWADFLSQIAPTFNRISDAIGAGFEIDAIGTQAWVSSFDAGILRAERSAEGFRASASDKLSGAFDGVRDAVAALGEAVTRSSEESEDALAGAGAAAGSFADALDATGGAARGAGGAARAAAQETATAVEDAAAAAEDAVTAWMAVTEALADYDEKAREIGGDIGQALVGAFQNAENAVADFVKSGKLSIRDLVTSTIADLARLGARRFLLGPLAGALSGVLGGAGGVFASVLHAGGVVGDAAPQRLVPALAFAGAARLHDGGWPGLRPDEVPAILQRGERVLSRSEAVGYGASGNVTVHIHARDAESFRQSRTQVAADIARAVSLGRRGL
jgi:tape measure domain-containing protein